MLAAEAEAYRDAPVYGTAAVVRHDPFGLDAALMGPQEKGIDLGFSMGE
jgi:hypothetical protein